MSWARAIGCGLLLAGLSLAVALSCAVPPDSAQSLPPAAAAAPIVQPVAMEALLPATGGGEMAEWERYVRSSAQPLPLAPEAGSSTAVEASGHEGTNASRTDVVVSATPGASATAFEHSTREAQAGEVVGQPATAPAPALTEAEVYAAALAVSGSERWAREAVAVSWCESRWQPGAVGAAGERGIYQLHPVHGPVPDGLLARTEMAYALWLRTGWSAWTCGVTR